MPTSNEQRITNKHDGMERSGKGMQREKGKERTEESAGMEGTCPS